MASSLSRLSLAFRVPPRPILIFPKTTILHHAGRPLSSSSHRTSTNPNPQHDAQQDREKINTDANEYAKSGTDDTAAANKDAAFNTDTPAPEDAKAKAGEGNQVNPLDASPANQDISQPTAEEEGGAKKKISEGGGGRSGGGDRTGGKKGSQSI